MPAAGAPPPQDLQSQLDAKQAKLSKVQERKGVLTTTISRYDDRIDRLTAEVAQLRDQEAGVRPASRQAGRLDRAMAQLTSRRSTWRWCAPT